MAAEQQRSPGARGTRIPHFGLWLWPLPPPGTFEFAVEWPFGGIGLSICELDGTAVTEAARRPVYYWPG